MTTEKMLDNEDGRNSAGCLGAFITAIAFIAGLVTGAICSAEILERILG